MSRTISTTKPAPDADGNTTPPDLDGSIVDKNESLSQRIRCAFRFRLGEYFLDTSEGLDYDLLFGHIISPAQASQIMVDVIRTEGGAEVRDVQDIQYGLDPATRRFKFACKVITIHGNLDLDTEI